MRLTLVRDHRGSLSTRHEGHVFVLSREQAKRYENVDAVDGEFMIVSRLNHNVWLLEVVTDDLQLVRHNGFNTFGVQRRTIATSEIGVITPGRALPFTYVNGGPKGQSVYIRKGEDRVAGLPSLHEVCMGSMR